ncbi:helix-turn-helix transcriptional regulator [Intrasporangium sp.]|uniref:helix-turn-helix transcriptional regulator n=1 Tax=Intrasporangium sp. TaxID=1925024 RepID=UPI00293A2848|nr:WYL domain-containing protein [Intrasporangium sp.]MDV3221249.1 WYL domain-containing protein [Intrasporangium sp.]
MNRTERLHGLTEALRRAGRHGRTSESLAAEFEVSVRTVKRDLAALMTQGLPMWARTGPGGGYVLDERTSLPPVNFSAAQAVALCAAVAASSGAPFADSARSATRKVLDTVDPSTRARARSLTDRVWVDVGPGAPRRVMTALEGALTEQVTVNLVYEDGAGRVTRREVEPMIFALTGGRWYLVAWCRLRRGVRWFRLERVSRAVATRTACPERPVSAIGPPPPSARTVEP